MDQFLFASIADWLINLSAGWFAAAVIVPALSEKSPARISWWLLTGNLLLAILSLLFATQIRRSLGVI